MTEILIKNACVISCDNNVVIPDGYVLIKDNLIVAIGKSNELTNSPTHKLTIDAGGRIVMPGFINPHMHLYSQFARGMAVPKMRSFLEILESLWWRLDRILKEEDIYLSAVLGTIEAIKSGVTTVIDHHASYGSIKGSLSAIAEALSEIGMRGAFCYEVSDRDGEKRRDQAINENLDFLSEVSEKRVSQNYLFRGMFGLHASFTLSQATIKKVIKANGDYNAPYHIHVAEGIEDLEDAKSRYNTSVVKRLYDEGILTAGTIAAHCIHINDVDIDLLKKSGTFVVHNPVSNMNNAVGRAPYLKLCKAEIPVGIGTDGMSAGISADVKAASVVHKENVSDPQAGWNEVKESALKVNPQIASNLFGQELGVLKKGSPADIIITDYIPYTEISAENYWAHVLFGVINSSVHTTIVNGRILMEDHKLKTIDESAVTKEAVRLSRDIWRRFQK